MASTKTTTEKQPRQSREGQRQQRITTAYRSLSLEGAVRGDPTLEAFRIASTSQPGTHYTVTHDLAHDRYICDCTAGQYGNRNCVHIEAAKRYVASRRTAIQKANDPAERACNQAEQRKMDTAPLRRDQRSFSLLA